MPLAVGAVLREKYRVERVLGEGGMAVVLEATHLGLQSSVAVKVLSSAALTRPESLGRFFQEARAMATLSNPHVVRVLDVDKLPSGEPFLVMEKLNGRDLGRLLDESGSVSPELAAEWVLQACEGVAEAHAQGLIHRDLKPSNLFLAERAVGAPIIKVCDFGIAKFLTAEAGRGSSPQLTSTQQVVGSPAYMAPEQIRTPKEVDFRADIWALGVILHELVTGRLPHERETVTELLTAICMDDVAPLSSLRSGVPADLEAIVSRCLQRAPADRYASVLELAETLRAALRVRASLRPRSHSALAPTERPEPPVQAVTHEALETRALPLVAAKETSPLPLLAPKQAGLDAPADLPIAKPRWPLFAAGGAVLALAVGAVLLLREPSVEAAAPAEAKPASAPSAETPRPAASAAASASAAAEQAGPPPTAAPPSTGTTAAPKTTSKTKTAPPPPGPAAPPAKQEKDGRTAF